MIRAFQIMYLVARSFGFLLVRTLRMVSSQKDKALFKSLARFATAAASVSAANKVPMLIYLAIHSMP